MIRTVFTPTIEAYDYHGFLDKAPSPETLPIFLENASYFVVGHHCGHEDWMRAVAGRCLQQKARSFDIFGTYCCQWASAIRMVSSVHNLMDPEERPIWASPTDLRGLVEHFALCVHENPEQVCYLISDDDAFTDFIRGDLRRDLAFCAQYPLKKFREGFEFRYQGRDCILSIHEDTMIGYLGQEETFPSKEAALTAPIFGKKCFQELWITKQLEF